MADEQILARITAMVDEERGLREAVSSGRIDSETEHERLAEIERALDQCWDLLRQRRAKSEFGENPDDARVRPASQVEGYQG
ncbi:hypothetical protein MBT84_06450 [Streptomyces sp. MBT84]|jgi:uncharacterized protein DUF2630|uniref:DUF2630 family protein n=1 Tax=unclassified Streptomyces TaxID=2593676 RepID=UPI0007412315|nr:MULTISPECIES: DUF2630 family protein [unclassified Streptomyces]KUJ47458.1 hypothetical protein ADL25_11095 [Streptomyces sp. NRRL F-5122]MBW8699225.1 hypothetical protein [Streptomyces sp. MBT84]MDX3263656.1 DUF2630 family protein [Streptomyces sp. MI02-2A]REE65016.1 uncharacterized protein DUF2630 [Streptomyces sp. 3212.3]